MMQKRTEKKIFLLTLFPPHVLVHQLSTLVESVYTGLFKVYRKSSTAVAIEYLSGLLSCEKGHKNMERMVEQVKDPDYKRYIHFLPEEWAGDLREAI